MNGYAVNREPLPQAPAWTARAFCAGLVFRPPWGPEQVDGLVFPPNEETTVGEMSRLLCSHCSVRPECLAYAVENHLSGNWAGTTTANRHAIRRRRGRAKCPVCLSTDVVLDTPDAMSLEELHQVCTACGHSWLTDRLPEAVTAPVQAPAGPKRMTVKGRNRAVVTLELPEAV